MDGLTDIVRDEPPAALQHTLKAPIACVGTGLHTGRRVRLGLGPAPVNTGIVFRRTDLGLDLPARYDLVTDTRLCTALALAAHPEARVGTIEHLLAALAACGIDNAIVTLDGPEIPVFDGSAAPFVFLIDCAGQVEQPAPRQVIQILRPVRVDAGPASAELRPSAGFAGLELSLAIDFPAPAIGRQALTLRLTEASFRAELSEARTFTMRADIENLQEAGLALGGSLKNAIVVDGAEVLNPEGLRQPDEFVRHKLQDAVGDLALAGYPIQGRFIAHRTGHALNNRLLRTLMADPSAWRLATLESAAWSQPARAAA